MSDEVVEAVARALHDADWRQQIGLGALGQPRKWETNPEQEWWREEARAAITAHLKALEDKGMVVVPREPTQEMVVAAAQSMTGAMVVKEPQLAVIYGQPKETWQTMIAALEQPDG